MSVWTLYEEPLRCVRSDIWAFGKENTEQSLELSRLHPIDGVVLEVSAIVLRSMLVGMQKITVSGTLQPVISCR